MVEKMKTQFCKAYMVSTGIILTVTGLGKLPGFFVVDRCVEHPMFGAYQPLGLSNGSITFFATLAELGIAASIFFGPRRWLSSLASTLWGAACLVARSYLTDGAHCSCLGWIEAPPAVVASFAGWLALGGLASAWIAWRDANPCTHPLSRLSKADCPFR